MSSPSSTSFSPPTPLGCHRAPDLSSPDLSTELNELAIQQIPTGYLVKYDNVYVSVLLSPFIPPSPSPTVFTSLFLMSVSPLLRLAFQKKKDSGGLEKTMD